MLDSNKELFLEEFMNEFAVAKQEVKQWSSQLKEDASKTGVLTFPRNPEASKQEAGKER
jgi:hypothetical protein